MAGVADERGHVGAEEVLALAEADDERAVAAGADDGVRLVGVHGEQGEGAVQVGHGLAHGRGQVAGAVEGRAEQVGDDLGVGLGGELDPLGLQAALEGVEVLDDAVVHERELAVPAAPVGVGVGVGGAAVGGPAGVADRGRRLRQRGVLQRLAQVGQLAGPLAGHDLVVADEGHARRVVAAVLEPAEALHHDVQGLVAGLRADVSDDSTHGVKGTS